MKRRSLDILGEVARGEIAPEAALEQLGSLQETALGFAVVDDHRALRTGLPEVIYGQGKSPAQLVALIEHLNAQGHPALATRVDEGKAEQVLAELPDVTWEPVPRLLWRAPAAHEPFARSSERPLWVVSAGTSDGPIAEEAARCAEWFGLDVHRAPDVGVAGLHRLLSRVEALREAHAVIAVAGMEGALPSVVAGLVRCPVIAVPTSVGYGTHLHGLAPLLAMLNSCAAGVAVVNVDNGFGAAVTAWRILEGAR